MSFAVSDVACYNWTSKLSIIALVIFGGGAYILMIRDFSNYSLEEYERDIDTVGLFSTWERIISSVKNGTPLSGIITVENLGALYENGLARTNKIEKKECGKYFTPFDVAHVMSEWLNKQHGENVADVCCGTGNLILEYLRVVGIEEAREFIASGNLYLYDTDGLAVKICCMAIGATYGFDVAEHINVIIGDFLSKDVELPDDCRVISNPPYARIQSIKDDWERSNVISKTRELYAAFMEKIIEQSASAVIITPYSFLGGEKFLPLRMKMNNSNGFVVSFDNIPGNIFSGRKQGIFNTNNANSVRAAITVVENREGVNGFKCSPLIRFGTDERKRLLDCDTLEQFLGKKMQVVDANNSKFVKCFPKLESVYEKWIELADGHTISEVCCDDGKYTLCMPNTCRYHTVATKRDLNRTGKTILHTDSDRKYVYLYCLLNSSFCYWWWRIFDGGITYPKALLNSLPDISHVFTDEYWDQLSKIASDMMARESDYLVYKKNAGAAQENVKFPDCYRQNINYMLLSALGVDVDKDEDIFSIVHANKIFVESREKQHSSSDCGTKEQNS